MHGVSQNKLSLPDSDAASLEQQIIVVDHTVPDEATHRRDVLFGEIEVSGGVGPVFGAGCLSDSVDSLVGLSSVMEPELTGSGDGPLDVGWMP